MFIVFLQLKGISQNFDTLVIQGFEFHGLRKTKEWFVRRELRFNEGDKILQDEVIQCMELITSDLRKTNLFLKIEIYPVYLFEETGGVRFKVVVQENWYIYPSVLFEIADPDFNVWWTEHHRSLKRVNYGFGLNHVNFTGVRDQFKIKLQAGYLRKLQFLYNRPALFPKSKIGLFSAFYYSEHKEIPIQITNNKPVYKKLGDTKIYLNKEAVIGLNFKQNKFWNYAVEVHYFNNKINRQLATEFPNYFLNENYLQIYNLGIVTATYFDMDHILRPTRGLQLNWTIKKAGLIFGDDLNYLNFNQTIKACKKIFKNCYLQTNISGELALVRKQKPLNIYKGLDYNDTGISGYEFYEIDGLDFIYNHNEFRYFVGAYTTDFFKRLLRINSFLIKTDLDLSFQFNSAYINDPFYFQFNSLTNKILFSLGPGLNFTINEVFQFNINYSVNHLKEDGIYFHTRKAF